MGFQVRGGREPLLADITLVRLLAGVHQVVLLEVGKLGEGFGTDVALEGPLARVGSQVDLKVGQLSEGLAADVAFVVHFAVSFAKRVWQTTVASGTWTSRTHGAATSRVGTAIRTEAAGWGASSGRHVR